MESKEIVYLVAVEHSPELYNDCGTFEVLGVFATYESAMSKAKAWMDDEKLSGYYVVDDFVTDDGRYIVSTYKDGNEGDARWSQLSIVTHEVFE